MEMPEGLKNLRVMIQVACIKHGINPLPYLQGTDVIQEMAEALEEYEKYNTVPSMPINALKKFKEWK